MSKNILKARLSETWKNDKALFLEGGIMLALFVVACFSANYVRENHKIAEQQTSVQKTNTPDSIKNKKTILYNSVIRR